MKLSKNTLIETPYQGIDETDYQIEKRRLQVELLKLQQHVVKKGLRLAVLFEGRDAAGKGSTIKRFNENLMPSHFRTVELGIPTAKESKYWFRRYEQHLPNKGEIVFFDRSWYSRATIQPTMGYCSEAKYKYFMKKVLPWEQKLIDQGLLLVKIYLSITKETQLYRFENRLSNPLTYWKFSENDLKARKKWQIFTQYKNQMLERTSADFSPWAEISANRKKEARLTAMLYLIRCLGHKKFIPLTGEDVTKTYSLMVGGVKFRGLTLQQKAVLKELKDQENIFADLDE